MAAYVRLEDPADGNNNHVLHRYNTNAGTAALFKQGSTDKWFFQLRDTTTASHFANASAVASEGWQMLIGTYDKTNMSLYVNGVQVDQTALALSIDTSSFNGLYIGAHSTSPNANSLRGWIGFVGVWSRCLSKAECELISGDPFAMFRLDDDPQFYNPPSAANNFKPYWLATPHILGAI